MSDSDDSESNVEEDVEEATIEDKQSDDERTNIRSELSNMSFEDLIKLKEKLGAKVYKEAVFGADEIEKPKKTIFKRENKNRPREMSSKRPVPLINNKAPKNRPISDPRFDPKCGQFNAKKFEENFDFVTEIKANELIELKKQLKQTQDPDERKNITFLIRRQQNQTLEKQKLEQQQELFATKKTDISDGNAELKKPFYLSDRERKAQELVHKYVELKNSGKLDKHLEKRRKKNAMRDRKKFKFD